MDWAKAFRELITPSSRKGGPETADWADGVWNREIFDGARESLLIMWPDGRLAAGNPAACRAFARPSQDVEQNSVQEVFRARTDDMATNIEEQARSTTRAEVACVAVRGDGTTFDAIVHGVPISHRGAPAFLLSIEDLTERQQADLQYEILSRKVLVAQEDERSRISRDLHDGLGQIIAAMNFELGMVRQRLTGKAGVEGDEFVEAAALVESAGEKLRQICRGLRPPMLDDLGLIPAVRQLAEEFGEHWNLEIDADIRPDDDEFNVPPDTSLCVFRVLQEALTNVVRHAEASRVSVTLVRDYQWLTLSVFDNGKGFDTGKLAAAQGYGVEGMKERARLVRGSLEVRAVPGQGTRVSLRVPVPRETEEVLS